MTDVFPFNSYRLRDGRFFIPSYLGLFESNVRTVVPDYTVSRSETVKILYDYRGVPITLTGTWDSKLQDWVFEVMTGLSAGGEEVKAIKEAIRESLDQRESKSEESGI